MVRWSGFYGTLSPCRGSSACPGDGAAPRTGRDPHGVKRAARDQLRVVRAADAVTEASATLRSRAQNALRKLARDAKEQPPPDSDSDSDAEADANAEAKRRLLAQINSALGDEPELEAEWYQ